MVTFYNVTIAVEAHTSFDKRVHSNCHSADRSGPLSVSFSTAVDALMRTHPGPARHALNEQSRRPRLIPTVCLRCRRRSFGKNVLFR
ncbi:hypothetical protein CDAR_379611 [Caerostris darwini]|uniref:Uncharacterized protein n=1 Tax=Caerostris darwini TaxID=1538125 RepID=A0AAV4RMR2_9ARAC|nr:hypothetical protein CDAR_379611 [Caerostris darwini]